MAAITLALSLGPSGSGIALADAYDLKRENQYFDSNRTDAAALLKKSYSESKALFLGAANHRNWTHHHHLMNLLKEVGRDPRLKFLVLEQFYDNDELYRSLSRMPLDEVLKTHVFPNQHSRLLTLCWSREWSWVYTNLFPLVQQINAERPVNNPLLVRAVDGFSSTTAYGLLSFASVKPHGCKLNAPFLHNTHENRQNRETATARIFDERIWSALKDEDKIIVLYHQNHLYRHFESCRITRTDDGDVSAIGPRNWMGGFLNRHPEAESSTRLIIFDESDENHHPHGVLRFTQRQTDRYPGRAWAIDVRGMSRIDLERGQNAWQFSGNSYANGGMNHSDRYFYEIVDGIIFSPHAGTQYRIPSVKENLPELCAEDYDGSSALPPNERIP